MAEPSEKQGFERFLPAVLLAIAGGIGLILYFKGGSPTDNLKILTGYVTLIIVFGLGLQVLYQIAMNRINLKFLLAEENGHASMSRLQLLIFTFVIGLSIVMMVISSKEPKFPAIPNEVLMLLGISASTYAVSKGIQKSAEPEADAKPAKPAETKPPADDGAEG